MLANFKVLLHHFLETSTIHGLQHISDEKRKVLKGIWIFIVFCGFSTAGLLIMDSVRSWEESPVSTSVETLPISEVSFPEVTVCPPEGSNTALNHDMMTMKRTGLSKEERLKALTVLWETMEVMENNKGWSKEDIKQMYQGCLSFSYMTKPCNHKGTDSWDLKLPNCSYEVSTCPTGGAEEEEEEEPDCLASPKGLTYRGSVSRTKSGEECMTWTEGSGGKYNKETHRTQFGTGDHNFCRNPSNHKGTWCYKLSDGKWEDCLVPLCAQDGSIELGAECVKASRFGMDYRGTVAESKDGRKCTTWTEGKGGKYNTETHRTQFGTGGHNFCRNPSEHSNPWCYLEDGRWADCSVQDCTHNIQPKERFRLWTNLLHQLTVHKKVTMNDIVRGVALAKFNSTSKGNTDPCA